MKICYLVVCEISYGDTEGGGAEGIALGRSGGCRDLSGDAPS